MFKIGFDEFESNMDEYLDKVFGENVLLVTRKDKNVVIISQSYYDSVIKQCDKQRKSML